jgi:diguanylate cyclase
LTAIWLGLGLGLLQLLAGVVIGWSLTRRVKRDPCAAEASQLHRLAQHVHGLVRDVHGQVNEHQTEIQRIRHELRSDPGDQDSIAAAIYRSVSNVIQVNERLQDQLFQAEQQLDQKERQIESHMAEARTDALTSLPNRRAFDDAMKQQAALLQRNGTRYGLIHLDIDHFKQLNDRWGHPAGDEVLKSVAAALRRAARQTDLVARIGGEEFSVVLPNVSEDEVIAASERIRAAVEGLSIQIQGTNVPVTISVGAARVGAGEASKLLIDRSDAALYASKEGGRNCSHWHDGQGCRRVTATEGPSLNSSPTPQESPPEWQDESSWRRVCDDLRRSLADLVGRDG